MSYYFNIATNSALDLLELRRKFNVTNLEMLISEKDANSDWKKIIFWAPGQSARGALLYRQDEQYQIQIPTFSTIIDIEIAVKLAYFVGKLTSCDIVTQDGKEIPCLDDMLPFFSSEWQEQQKNEGIAVILAVDKHMTSSLQIPCPLAPLNIDYNYLQIQKQKYRPENLLDGLLRKAVMFQHYLHQTEITIPEKRIISQIPNPTTLSICYLSPHTRYLAIDVDYFLLETLQGEIKWLKRNQLEKFALAQNWHFFDAISFEIPPLDIIQFNILLDLSKNEPDKPLVAVRTLPPKPKTRFWRNYFGT